ncbi:MAG: hypothetical protein L3J29_08765 [Cyclobacteriaceae bacterium]|nr:hypothetical protein [Cyclobacteriaceae bacterium]
MNKGKILILAIFIFLSTLANGQYTNQTADVYSSKQGNLFVKASYTSTNRSMSDRTIFLRARNEASSSRDMITWTNGGYDEIRIFIYALIYGLDKPVATTFQVGYLNSANVVDANNLKVMNSTMGGYSHFNRKEMLLLLQAIRDK